MSSSETWYRMNSEGLYAQLPVPLQNLVCSIEGWRINRSRYSRLFWNALKTAELRSMIPADRVRRFRDARLRTFVRHAAENVPYYRDQFKRLGIDPRRITSLEDLSALPILAKEVVQQNPALFRAENVPPTECVIAHTGGTTGAGLRFTATLEAQTEQWAIWWRYRRWHGIPIGEWCGYFGGRSVVPTASTSAPFWRYNHAGKQLMFSSYHLNDTNLSSYIDELRRSRPRWLHGYPSLLALVAAYVVERDIDLGYEIKWVTIGAENLLPHQAEIIRRAFGCRPVQHYGMTEAVANISECPLGSLHVDEDFSAVEFVPSGDGEETRIVGTNFSNFAFPLLRYDPHDVVTLSNRTCACGRPGRVVQQIDGRHEDYLTLANGARIGCLNHVFKDMVNIREAQLQQRRVGEVEILVARSRNYGPADESALIANLKQKTGDDTSVRIRYVDSVPRTRSGKLRMVVSEIPDAQQLINSAGEDVAASID